MTTKTIHEHAITRQLRIIKEHVARGEKPPKFAPDQPHHWKCAAEAARELAQYCDAIAYSRGCTTAKQTHQ